MLGIDPGTVVTGWAVIQSDEGRAKELWSGHVKTESRDSGPKGIGRRLKTIHDSLNQVFRLHPEIEQVAFEGGFVGRQPQQNLVIGYARGLAMLTAAEHNVPHFEYPPATVKKTVTNFGHANKDMMNRSIINLFQIEPSLEENEADAIGVALCHLIKIGEVWWLG